MLDLDKGNWNSIEWAENRDGVKRAEFAMSVHNFSCGIGEYRIGHALYPHSHPNEQVSICIKGCCDYYIDGVPYSMKPGSWIAIPAGVPHFIYVHEGTEPCVVMDVSAPARPDRVEEYLKAIEHNQAVFSGE